ncbi:MAG: hypothetical protein QNJ61_18835 [Desulfobacterales bacterium]|nr:hypothetical protein [Desulfobacterales bacterium]
MPASHNRKLLIGSLLAAALILILTLALALTRSQRDIPRSAAGPAEPAGRGFNFFDVHADTVLSRSLRQTLEDQLGQDAISHRAPIDLTVIDLAFTQTTFPEIHRYHMALNPASGGRREHAVTTLTYRRAPQKGVPFGYIKLVFAQDTGKPLYLVIEPTEDDPYLFETLHAKHGPPATVNASREGDAALIWRQPDEILTGVTIRRRGGRIDRQLRFYFMANIRRLVEQEREDAAKQRRQADKASRRAF